MPPRSSRSPATSAGPTGIRPRSGGSPSTPRSADPITYPTLRDAALVASIDLRWGEHATPLVVPPLTRNQSVQLLRARHTALRPNEAGRVAAPLEVLPLTVDTAAATLAASAMGVDAYLRLIA